MANMRLRETILAVVDNQLRDNDPPCTRRAYERLRKAGYSRKEAKEKLAAVVLEEIYDVMSQNQPFDEERFERALDDMVQRCIDYEDDSGLPSGWDEIADLIDEGWEYAENQDYENMTRCWLEAWDKTKENVNQAEIRLGISAVDEATDYEYDIGGWLYEMELELFNAKAHEICIQFCHEVLDTFVWEYDDYGGFKAAIGESLNALGRRDEGKKWFEDWLEQEPHHPEAINGYAMSLAEEGKAKEAYRLVDQELGDGPCTMENEALFHSAVQLTKALGMEDRLSYYKEQIGKFYEEPAGMDEYGDVIFGDDMLDEDTYDGFYPSFHEPVVKPPKIYPNDPCPCGSGKKYKKCCGKNV